MFAWIIGVLLIALGFAVKLWPGLIAGYNRLPEAKRKSINLQKLTSVLRNMLVLMGVSGIALHYLLGWLDWLSIQPFATSIAIFFITPILVIRLNRLLPPKRPKG
jgi:hypothetical protein